MCKTKRFFTCLEFIQVVREKENNIVKQVAERLNKVQSNYSVLFLSFNVMDLKRFNSDHSNL